MNDSITWQILRVVGAFLLIAGFVGMTFGRVQPRLFLRLNLTGNALMLAGGIPLGLIQSSLLQVYFIAASTSMMLTASIPCPQWLTPSRSLMLALLAGALTLYFATPPLHIALAIAGSSFALTLIVTLFTLKQIGRLEEWVFQAYVLVACSTFLPALFLSGNWALMAFNCVVQALAARYWVMRALARAKPKAAKKRLRPPFIIS